MTPRSSRHPAVRSPGRGRAASPYQRSSPVEPPQQRQPPQVSAPPLEPVPPRIALEHALSITTATSEQELGARTAEAAGRLTGAAVACAIDPSGGGHTWGEAGLAAAVLAELRKAGNAGLPEHEPACGLPCGAPPYWPTDAFAHLGLPGALSTAHAGTLVVVGATEPDRFGPEAGPLLSLVVAHATAGRDRLRELALLARRADRDPLTGLRHYRPFEERLAASVPDRTAVIAVDIDNFKKINDEHGHQAGDEALVTLVGALGQALRGDDHIYRIGGDEFAVVVDVSSPDEVAGIARRLLFAARAAGYPISVGAAVRRVDETGRETLLRADRALYQAKRDGRNTGRIA